VEPEHPSAAEFLDVYGPEAVARFRSDRDGVNAALARLADDNPETLFMLKQHPAVLIRELTELRGLEGRPNVMVVREEEAIADCLAASDVWTAYDSTTCLEAWLLDKPTLLINPTGEDFDRPESYRGSPVFTEIADVQRAIDSWYAGDGVPGFDERAPTRREVIEQTIQWDDGRNHLRAVHFIEELLARAPAPAAPSLRDRAYGLVQGGLYRGAGVVPRLPLFRAFAPARRRFREDELARVTRRAAEALERFDPAHELTEADLRELDEINMVTLPR
jgi:CDP-glycerol glycerophosphotransferase (TagB/SpsB family)